MKLVGKAYIKYDGNKLRTKTGATIDIGGQQRTPVVGNQLDGYTEEAKPSEIDCVISLGAGESLETIRNITDATVTFECDTGQSYMVRHAFLSDTLKVTGGEGGNIPLKLIGPLAEEI